MYKHFFIALFWMSLATFQVFSQEEKTKEATPAPGKKKESFTDEVSVTTHSIKIDGIEIPYLTVAGTQVLTGEDEEEAKAGIFYVAYTRTDIEDVRNRPITFCFNGGPGSSSVWLHLGIFGPKRVDINHEGKEAKLPFRLLENPYSMLDVTDLVFIDPISTGFSRASLGEDKKYHGVEADIQSVAEFIRLYITRNGRWESPKFLAGESYGTTRAAGLALELNDTHYIHLDGVILLSCVLNFQTIRFVSGNDLPYVLFLPTYATTALYHHRLAEDLQKDVKKTMAEVQDFALTEYATALMYGQNLDPEKRQQVVEKLVAYTGLSREFIEDNDLRINIFRFAKELLRDEKRTVGRFDSRLKGINSDVCSDVFEFDPSFENIVGLFAATFNDYVRRDLLWKKDDEYKILADVWPWDYGTATNQYLDVGEDLQEVMSKNTKLEVFVASGYCDLATPYFATEYTFSHLGLDPSLRKNAVIKEYEGGHMMYLYHPTLVKMKADLASFIKGRVSRP